MTREVVSFEKVFRWMEILAFHCKKLLIYNSVQLFLKMTFRIIIWIQLLWFYILIKLASTLFLKRFLHLFASVVKMIKFQNFVRIILLLMAFVILMKKSTVIKLFKFPSTYLIIIFYEIQKQPPELFYKRSCS